ncbi:hypothetical protein LJ655_02065 [Paraburkholderia sp. MMS20-SJTN17]|uniref:Uncharacterized protein n=1 Tax=Paraburkholderia translucens TaxID=2886945 RepID=A0ABS8K7J2_9BURK|nr:hypothetical protein [Paraburkholderia sp. MMS20-SJTN17]MCC8400689.1 hypothetical protein [Paraburkholderia sp. MMS20-SJTN17]
MATPARSLFKAALFIGLCLVSVRYLPLSNEWTAGEARAWWRASDWLGVPDPDDLYFVMWLTVELFVAALAYAVIVRLWRHYQRKKTRA